MLEHIKDEGMARDIARLSASLGLRQQTLTLTLALALTLTLTLTLTLALTLTLTLTLALTLALTLTRQHTLDDGSVAHSCSGAAWRTGAASLI